MQRVPRSSDRARARGGGRQPVSVDRLRTADLCDDLRRAIITGRLRPGALLVEAEVSARYGVSKSPAREALKVLQQEGLVDVIPRRGYVVTPITVKQIRDLFDLRLILERESAMVAARTATEDDIAVLRRLSGDRYVPGDPESYARFLTENRSFHLAVAQVSRNDRLTAVLARLLDDLERLFHLGLDVRDRSESLIHEHHAVVDAVVARDAPRAGAVMVAQIENARQMVLEAVMSGSLAAQVG